MNIDELAHAVRAALDEEYADYSPAAGRGQLEDAVINDVLAAGAHNRLAVSATTTPSPAAPAPRPSGGWVSNWSAQGNCATANPDELFAHGAAQNRAKAVCVRCPVRMECLAEALDNREEDEFGVWGGMSARERRALKRRHPTVTSWRQLLETARMEYERRKYAGLLPLEPEDDDLMVLVMLAQ